MVGDDVRDDVLGAQNVGFAVSTMKYFLKENAKIAIVDNLSTNIEFKYKYCI